MDGQKAYTVTTYTSFLEMEGLAWNPPRYKIPEKVFGFTYESLASCFWDQRKRTVRKLGNPKLRKITFATLRHWKGTMLYHKTKDILYVKKIFGPKAF